MRSLSESELAIANARSQEGSAEASMDIAEHYLSHDLREEARRYYVLAAKQGSSAAANAAAVLYAEVGANEEAVEWLRVACRAGNKLACTHLSIAYSAGSMGLKEDKEKAAEYGRLGNPLE